MSRAHCAAVAVTLALANGCAGAATQPTATAPETATETEQITETLRLDADDLEFVGRLESRVDAPTIVVDPGRASARMLTDVDTVRLPVDDDQAWYLLRDSDVCQSVGREDFVAAATDGRDVHASSMPGLGSSLEYLDDPQLGGLWIIHDGCDGLPVTGGTSLPATALEPQPAEGRPGNGTLEPWRTDPYQRTTAQAGLLADALLGAPRSSVEELVGPNPAAAGVSVQFLDCDEEDLVTSVTVNVDDEQVVGAEASMACPEG